MLSRQLEADVTNTKLSDKKLCSNIRLMFGNKPGNVDLRHIGLAV